MSDPAPGRPPSPFVALRHRNFRLLWSGQLLSNSGTMMQNAAILWHVSLLVPEGQRALALGIVGLVRIVPIIVFSLIGGMVADSIDRRRLMLVTQAGMALSAALLALHAFSGAGSLWPVYVLTALSATFTSFDSPARQSLFPVLVPREHLSNAISLNTIMFQTASVAGPALGGLLIAVGGVGWVYALNAVSFGFVIAALLRMRDVPGHGEGRVRGISRAALSEGLGFVFRTPLIRSTMLLDFFATFFASALALLPIFAQDVLGVGAEGYGLLAAAPSVGAIATSAALVPLIDRIRGRGRVMLWSVALYGLATVVFGMSRSFWLTFGCLALTGAADTVSMVIRNVIRQLHTPDHLRGRMTGVNMMFFMGGPQLGELEAGLVASVWSAPVSVVTGGIACMIATGWIAWRTPDLRRYVHDLSASQAGPSTPPAPGPA